MRGVLLELLQLADSALPVGGAAHSFGLESMIEDGFITAENLAEFLTHHLQESGRLEATFVRRASRGESLSQLSMEFDARRLARESREASLKIGRRFADLCNTLSGSRLPGSLHYPVAFGGAGAFLAIPEETITLAYSQQTLTGLISACQRLMPLGQVAASKMLWNLRPTILRVVAESSSLESVCFNPLPELGSMRHSLLETRLFIS